MTLLILSDSHGDLKNMATIIDREIPQAVFHLGDHDSDAARISKQFPQLPFYSVSGNCDSFCSVAPDSILTELEGVRILAVHGHKQNVKLGMLNLSMTAREAQAQLVLFGHTHQAYCQQEEDGLWVLNPGSCGYYGGSAGLILADNGKIWRCLILKEEDLLDLHRYR